MGQLHTQITDFLRADDGAITVDYVVGVAAGIALAISLMNAIGGATEDHASEVGDKYEEVGIRTY